MIAPRAPFAGLERLGCLLMPRELRNDELEEALHARRLAFAGEDQRLFGRDREGLILRVMLDITRSTNRSEPLVEVFGIEAGLRGELADRHWAGAIKGGEHSSLVAEIRHEQAQRSSDIADHLSDQAVERGLVDGLGHGILQI